MDTRKLLGGVALTALSLLMPSVAFAQSTASQSMEDEVIVTGNRRSVDGAISAETASKARSTITQEYIATQPTGQTILNTINLAPGVNFTNTDGFGSAGGNLNIRGFDGARISLTFDGIQLNDTGNYAIYPNQQLDPELIQRANVNLGTTDVDSPTASATGGTVNYVTVLPDETPGLIVQPSVGSWDYHRIFLRADTGAIGPFGTTMFGAISAQDYSQFLENPGDLEKRQYNFRIYQPLGDNGDFISASFHYNENRNDFYRQVTLAQFNAGIHPVNDAFCIFNGSNCGTSALTNYRGWSINPSNTGNIRIQSQFSITPNLKLTFDPSFQYVLADGGSNFVYNETDQRLASAATSPISVNPSCSVVTGNIGVDLNGDCDTGDSQRLFQPNITNTRRYMGLLGLIWDINDHQRIRFGYTYDYGRHRQTGEVTWIGADGEPSSPFAGKDGWGSRVPTADGGFLRRRDRFSIAELSQWSAEYRGDFFDDALTLTIGLRAPEFTRELNNFCYQQPGNANPICTWDPLGPRDWTARVGGPINASGGALSSGAISYIAPLHATVKYDDILPNIGIMWRPAEGHQLFFSYAEGLSAPRTDDLYGITLVNLQKIEPETTQSYDLGWRYQGSNLILAATAWYSSFENRIERSYDQDTGDSYSTNIGSATLYGFDGELGIAATENLSFVFSTGFTHSEIAEDIQTGGSTFIATRGKEFYDTPGWTWGARASYDVGPFTFGLQTKWVDSRWTNLTNTEEVPAYQTWDANFRWDLGQSWANQETYIQVNVTNMFNETYLGTIGTNPSGTGFHQYGAPQTWVVSLHTEF